MIVRRKRALGSQRNNLRYLVLIKKTLAFITCHIQHRMGHFPEVQPFLQEQTKRPLAAWSPDGIKKHLFFIQKSKNSRSTLGSEHGVGYPFSSPCKPIVASETHGSLFPWFRGGFRGQVSPVNHLHFSAIPPQGNFPPPKTPEKSKKRFLSEVFTIQGVCNREGKKLGVFHRKAAHSVQIFF